MTITQGSTAPAAPQTPVGAGIPQADPTTATPQTIYRALQSQRQVLGEQLSTAQRTRERLVNQLSDGNQTQATRASLEKRIANVDERIASLDKQIAVSEQAVATAAAVPGATYRPPEPPRDQTDEIVGSLTALLIVCLVLPLSIAYARRIWRRSAKAEIVMPPETAKRMESLEQGMDAIALEVERIGEGQRFITQALTERVPERLPERVPERLAERR